jgi:hypothetical protein
MDGRHAAALSDLERERQRASYVAQVHGAQAQAAAQQQQQQQAYWSGHAIVAAQQQQQQQAAAQQAATYIAHQQAAHQQAQTLAAAHQQAQTIAAHQQAAAYEQAAAYAAHEHAAAYAAHEQATRAAVHAAHEQGLAAYAVFTPSEHLLEQLQPRSHEAHVHHLPSSPPPPAHRPASPPPQAASRQPAGRSSEYRAQRREFAPPAPFRRPSQAEVDKYMNSLAIGDKNTSRDKAEQPAVDPAESLSTTASPGKQDLGSVAVSIAMRRPSNTVSGHAAAHGLPNTVIVPGARRPPGSVAVPGTRRPPDGVTASVPKERSTESVDYRRYPAPKNRAGEPQRTGESQRAGESQRPGSKQRPGEPQRSRAHPRPGEPHRSGSHHRPGSHHRQQRSGAHHAGEKRSLPDALSTVTIPTPPASKRSKLSFDPAHSRQLLDLTDSSPPPGSPVEEAPAPAAIPSQPAPAKDESTTDEAVDYISKFLTGEVPFSQARFPDATILTPSQLNGLANTLKTKRHALQNKLFQHQRSSKGGDPNLEKTVSALQAQILKLQGRNAELKASLQTERDHYEEKLEESRKVQERSLRAYMKATVHSLQMLRKGI